MVFKYILYKYLNSIRIIYITLIFLHLFSQTINNFTAWNILFFTQRKLFHKIPIPFICENNTTKSLYTINTTDGSTESFSYFGYDHSAISKNGQLYGFKYTPGNHQIVELNTSNCKEIKTIKSIGSEYLKNMFYLNYTAEIIGDLSDSSAHHYFKCEVLTVVQM